jgi:hypothetical protein
MTPYTRNLLIAVMVLIVLVVAATVMYMKKYTVKLDISSMQVLSDGAISLNAPLPSGADASKWVGLKIRVSSKSLGHVDSVVGAVSPTSSTVSVATVPGAYTGKAPYQPSASDSARIYLRK